MEVMKINERSSKARSTRKSRSIEGGRKAKPARAAGSLRPAKPRRVARVVKRHAAGDKMQETELDTKLVSYGAPSTGAASDGRGARMRSPRIPAGAPVYE